MKKEETKCKLYRGWRAPLTFLVTFGLFRKTYKILDPLNRKCCCGFHPIGLNLLNPDFMRWEVNFLWMKPFISYPIASKAAMLSVILHWKRWQVNFLRWKHESFAIPSFKTTQLPEKGKVYFQVPKPNLISWNFLKTPFFNKAIKQVKWGFNQHSLWTHFFWLLSIY